MRRWPTKPLGEVCAINPKLSALEAPSMEADVSFIPMAAVDEISGSIAQPEIRKYGQVKKGYTPFRENDVLFAKITPCMENGKAAIARGLRDGLGFGSTEFHVIRPTVALLPEWVFALIRQPSFRDTAKANFTGTAGQQRVPADFLKTFPIPVPPLAEQERIVKLLDEADELRKLRAQADRRTANLIPALFHEMFGDPAKPHKLWPIVKVGDICAVKGGKRLPKGDKYSQEPTPFRYIRVSDIHEGRVDESNLQFLKPETQRSISRYTVSTGDLIITIAGTIGVIAPVGASLHGANLTENAAKLVPRLADKYDNVFLAELMQSAYVQNQIGLRTGQVTIGKLALFRIEQISFPLPPLSVQKEFAQRVTVIRELEAHQAASRTRLDALFESMLHRAFNGEL